MKHFLIATFFLIPLSGCSFFRNSSVFQPQEDFIYLECYRPETNEWKEWTIKLDIDLKKNTVDFYSQLDNFSEADHYSSDVVTITKRYINFGKPGFTKDTINRMTGSYKSEFLFSNDSDLEPPIYSCQRIMRFNNLF